MENNMLLFFLDTKRESINQPATIIEQRTIGQIKDMIENGIVDLDVVSASITIQVIPQIAYCFKFFTC
jgi:hypothetical protein